MTPDFAKVVDPVFNYVLDLRRRIDLGQQPSARFEHDQVEALLEKADAKVGDKVARDEWEEAKYALVAWVDELVNDSQWLDAEREWWSNNTLEFAFFKTLDHWWLFYERVKRAKELPRKDALEVFYLCVVLGFRGLYGKGDEAAHEAAQRGLPPGIEVWAGQVSAAIRAMPRSPITPKPRRQMGAPPLESQPLLMVAALATALLAAAGAGYFFG
ncbi:MAG TPA: DotU family type IV/VI secretion system protein [Pirellulales bacterium]|jgi:type VI secretion system protein ImpK|nr:DotU family type IV/VI secretion system protein [Pirellulales bacterium]